MKLVPVVLLAITSTAVAQPPAPRDLARKGSGQELAATGAVLLLTSWGLSFTAAAAGSLDRDDRALYAPVVGPWIVLARRADCPAEQHACSDAANDALLAIDGIVQVGSAVLLVSGLLEWRSDRARERDAARVRITPSMIGGGGPGLTVAGSF